ncbi:MAG: response regulator transcription factor [Dehalococcoidia bacterium]
MLIRILLIDEHHPAREILARRLGSLHDLEVVGSTGDSEQGLLWIEQLHPDLVLLDTKMDRSDGMEICRRACTSSGSVKVAVLTSFTDQEERRKARNAGASGYLLKEADTRKLVQQIREIALTECGPRGKAR